VEGDLVVALVVRLEAGVEIRQSYFDARQAGKSQTEKEWREHSHWGPPQILSSLSAVELLPGGSQYSSGVRNGCPQTPGQDIQPQNNKPKWSQFVAREIRRLLSGNL